MTHAAALTILLDAVKGEAPGQRPSPEARRDAEDHVARCSDCYATLALLHEAATGQPPPEAGTMEGLYGCEQIQQWLFLLADGLPEDLTARDPEVSRHLGWCEACQERVTELLAVTADARSGAYGEFLGPAKRPTWKATVDALGGRLNELAGRIVVQVGAGLIALTRVPDGLVPMPAMAPALARRGATKLAEIAGGDEQETWIPLGDSGRSAEIRVCASGGDPLSIEVRPGDGRDALWLVSLRIAASHDRLPLVASQTVHGAEPALFRDVPPGDYVVDIDDQESDERFRIAITAERG